MSTSRNVKPFVTLTVARNAPPVLAGDVCLRKRIKIVPTLGRPQHDQRNGGQA